MTAITLSPQNAAILSELRGGPCTTLQLQQRCGLVCVSSRIHELRQILPQQHLTIDTQLVSVRNRHGDHCHVAQYSLRRLPRRRRATTGRAA